MKNTSRSAFVGLTALLVALAVSGCAGPGLPAATGPALAIPSSASSAASVAQQPATPTATAAPGTALALLETLPIKGRAPKTGYSRDQFGPSWEDVDHNGCDTRNDILNRDLIDTTKDGSCKVMTGTLHDPYTAKVIDFVRGQETSALVQIDHVVALGDAWQKGAQQLTADQRLHFANDPLNLLAVDGPTNQAKGDGDAATWLPPNKSFRCAYVARQVSVKAAYALWVTRAGHDAIARILATCPDQPALTGTGAPPAEPAPAPAQPTQAAPAQPAPPSDVYYANCAAVRAAGKAPLHSTDPGYRAGLDGDHDGIACE